MKHNCKECYWYSKEEENCSIEVNDKENCQHFGGKCDWCGWEGEYKYQNKYYCFDCLMKLFGVETYIETHYHVGYRYLGSDGDIKEVIKNLDESIEILD